jgi:hypothetical protein
LARRAPASKKPRHLRRTPPSRTSSGLLRPPNDCGRAATAPLSPSSCRSPVVLSPAPCCLACELCVKRGENERTRVGFVGSRCPSPARFFFFFHRRFLWLLSPQYFSSSPSPPFVTLAAFILLPALRPFGFGFSAQSRFFLAGLCKGLFLFLPVTLHPLFYYLVKFSPR